MPGRESRDREYEVGLVAGVGIRYRLDIEQGEVTAFTIQLEDYDEADGKWRPVVRYDDAHGWPHCDVLDWAGRVIDGSWFPPGTINKEAIREA